MPLNQTTLQCARVSAGARQFDIEYQWLGASNSHSPLVVFLHEGLGSVAMWRDFPSRFCTALGCRGLVYSRPGYGASTPRPPEEKWGVDFMHLQAREVLPALLRALNIDVTRDKPWLFGHSDGASIALIHAASFPASVSAVIALAPHLFVEKISVDSIAKTLALYRTTDLKSKLARYHADVDSAFYGWNDIWLDPKFLQWNIEALLPSITCPVLAIQGVDDEYGTMAQIDRIKTALPHAQLLQLEQCGHSPHRDQPDAVIAAAREFLATVRAD